MTRAALRYILHHVPRLPAVGFSGGVTFEDTVWLFLPMAKPKRKLTPAQRREKARRQAEYMTVFINGKQKRVRRPPLIEGLSPDEFIRANADPIWLHQNGLWEDMPEFSDPSSNIDGDDGES